MYLYLYIYIHIYIYIYSTCIDSGAPAPTNEVRFGRRESLPGGISTRLLLWPLHDIIITSRLLVRIKHP